MGGDQILGTLLYFGGNFAPYQWYQCNGQLLSIAQNTALFSLLGTYYGGNGQTNFGLPNLQGRKVIGPSNEYVLGEAAGYENQTLSISNLATHSHAGVVTLHANADGATSDNPQNNFPGLPDNGGCYQSQATQGVQMASGSVTLAPAGGTQAFSIQNPILTVTICIAYQGVFPQRP